MKTLYLFRRTYIEELIAAGHSVIAVAPSDDTYSINKLESLGVIVKSVEPGNSICSKVVSLVRLNYIFLKESYGADRVCIHFIVTLLMFGLSSFLFSRKTTVFIEGLGSLIGNNKPLLKFMNFYLNVFPYRKIFCNEDEKEKLGNYKDIVLGGIGVDTEVFYPSRPIKLDSHKSLLYVGRIIKDKGFDDVVYCLRSLLNDDRNVSLTVVGDIYPNNPSSLTEGEIHSLNLEFGDRINFVGYVTQLVEYYQSSDFLLLPSRREGFPVCVMEASSVGIPSIVYDVPGCRDAIADRKNGLIVSNVSAEEFTKTVSLAIKTTGFPRARSELSSACRFVAFESLM